MMISLLDSMMALLAANMVLALIGAFFWGVASVVLSPCHLSGIPLIMGFVARESDGEQKSALRLSLVFSLGIFVALGILGLLTAALGRMLGDIGNWGNWLGAGIFAFVGLLLLDVVSIPALPLHHNRYKGGGAKAAFVLGILFGTVLGPCTFAFMMPVLGLVFSKATEEPVFAAGLALSYALGHTIIILLAGSASAWTMKRLQHPQHAFWLRLVRKVLGAVSILVSLWFAFGNQI